MHQACVMMGKSLILDKILDDASHLSRRLYKVIMLHQHSFSAEVEKFIGHVLMEPEAVQAVIRPAQGAAFYNLTAIFQIGEHNIG